MTKNDYPEIQQYRYLFHGIFYSTSNAGLDEACKCLLFVFDNRETLNRNHPEFPLLLEAGKQKRKELNSNDGKRD